MKRTKNSANKVWRLRVVTAQEADHGGAVGNGNDNDAGAAREEMARVGDRLDGEEIAAEIDDVLHRRHLSVYGKETMQRLSASNVLISGMSGLGAEIAKNIALAGVKSVTLHDVGNVEMWDLSANFFLTEDDIGRNRAISCVAKLQELNNSVLVSALTNELTIEHLSKFQVVVFTDIALDKAFEFNEYCRIQNPPIPFIKTEVCGLFGSIFCDFGPEFVVVDVDGHPPHTGTIASISNGNPAIVTCVDDEHLDFNDGDFIIFSEVQGMTELNDGIPRKIKVAGQFSLCIQEDTTNFGSYTKGGIVTQVKQPKILQFKSLRDSIEEPGNAPLSVCSNLTSPPLLHIAFLALDKFRQEVGRLPKSGCDLDAQQFVKFATALNEARIGYKMHGAIDEKSLQLFASGSKAVLSPMCAIFGGIVGQEVVKACSGKFHPLHQFFYFDSLESLPTYQLQPHDLEPLNCRYDAQISVFGSKLQRKMWNANVLIFGSGVLGCEYLKCLALMGLSCGPSGKLTITDDDEIDISHLSCQFLFRTQNIGQAKSIVSAAAAKTINPDLHIDPLVDRMCQESEFKFNYAFWESFDVVMSTVNNVKARKYMKMKCLYFHKPLLESGTMATQFTTQIIIPHISQSYGFLQEHCENGAIATSASLATGFVCLELYKVLSGVHQRSEYRNTIGDFSRPFIKVARPVQPNVNKHGELTWTAWDRWSIGVSNITFSYLINWLSQYDVTVDRVYAGRSLLLNTRDPQHEARLDKLVGDIAKQVAGNNVAENMTFLDICVKCVDGYGNPISLPVITINTSPIIVDKPPITTDVPPIPFEEFIKENELVKLITVETRSKPVKNSIGEKILSSIYRHIITTYRNGQSYGGRFTLRHLFVSKDNELCIAMKPEMESHPDNLEKDLRKVALLVLPKFRFDLQYPPFIRHLNKISEKMPVEAKLSKGALEIFLDIVYHHFAFTRAMDVHYLIIGLATSYNSLGTEDQLIIRTALEKVANYLELPFTWNWIGTVKSFTTMSNVIEKSKGKKDLSHAYHGSTALGAFMFSRHNGIHGAQNALVPLLEEGDSDQPQGESNPWSSTSASNLETEQQIDSPVYFFHVMAFGLGEVIAHSILCILMHADITMRKYITKVWKAYTREDDSD